jgi:hypothetical protein
MANGNNNHMQEMHNVWRKSLLQFVAIDYALLGAFRVIEANPRSPKGAPPHPHLPSPPPPKEMNKVDDVYRFVTNPVVQAHDLAATLHAPAEEFSTGNIPGSLLTAVGTIPEIPVSPNAPQFSDALFLDDVKPYIECRIDVVIQHLLSSSLLYTDALNELKKMDLKIREDTVSNHIRSTSDIPYLSEVTSIILHLIDRIGNFPRDLPTTGPVTFPPSPPFPSAREDLLKRFLQYDGTPWDADPTIDSRGGRPPRVGISFDASRPQAITAAGLDETFKLLFNLVKVDLSIIGSTTTAPPNDQDLVAINLDLTFLNLIVDLWGELLRSRSSSSSPIVIDYLANELPRIRDYFENSKSAPDVVQHIAGAKHAVRTYLESALSENRDAKIRDLSNNPTVDILLDNLRSLRNPVAPKTNIQPPEDQAKFLFSMWWILTETPRLSDFHIEAEIYSDPDPIRNLRMDPVTSAKIFPDIVDKGALAAVSTTLSLERIFNERKNNFSELNKEIQTPGGLSSMLLKARGVAI